LRGGRRKKNRGGEGRQSGDILTFTDGITDGLIMSVNPSVILGIYRSSSREKNKRNKI
jgi:hypothetical protein